MHFQIAQTVSDDLNQDSFLVLIAESLEKYYAIS